MRHPKPVDIALNYYGHQRPKHVGSINYGHSSKHTINSFVDRNIQKKRQKSHHSIKNKLTRSRRPPLTAKRKPMPNKRRKNPSSYSFDSLLHKKTTNQNKVINMPSHSYSFPLSRQDLSTAPSKIKAEPTIGEFVLGNLHKLGKKVFGR